MHRLLTLAKPVRKLESQKLISTTTKQPSSLLKLIQTHPDEELPSILKKSLKNGMNLEERCLLSGARPLAMAAYLLKVKTVLFLLQEGAKVHTPEHPALGAVTCSKHSDLSLKRDIMDALIQHGADVNEANQWGISPLHSAAIRGNVQIIRELIYRKADVFKPLVYSNNKQFGTAVSMAYKNYMITLESDGEDNPNTMNERECLDVLIAEAIRSLTHSGKTFVRDKAYLEAHLRYGITKLAGNFECTESTKINSHHLTKFLEKEVSLRILRHFYEKTPSFFKENQGGWAPADVVQAPRLTK